MFASARRIFGPSGSEMLNAVFAAPETKVVDVETFHVTVRQHANLYSCSSKEYCFIFEQPDDSDERPLFHRRWRLRNNLLREALEWAM
jgi:capsular polysaccharide biosynthesis protein